MNVAISAPSPQNFLEINDPWDGSSFISSTIMAAITSRRGLELGSVKEWSER